MARPKVAIGLPVYNGERYLRLALDSLLAQDYGDFELIISDNCSTDGTPEICLEYAGADGRIRFHRNERNVGAARNFNHTFRLASADYFMWAAHDDLWHPTYISRCMRGLGEDENIVLCASTVQFIDEAGHRIPEEERGRLLGGGYNEMNTRSLGLRERVRSLTSAINWYALYGIIRSDVLRQTRLFQRTFGSDVILLLELLLRGEIYVVRKRLFRYRIVPKSLDAQSGELPDADAPSQPPSHYTRLAISLLQTIDASGCAPADKIAMREDLLDNVTRDSRQWADLLHRENPMTEGAGEDPDPGRIRRLLVERAGAMCAGASA